MIARVEGVIQGIPISLSRVGDSNVWESPIPTGLESGMYVVEIRAYNEAGNFAFSTKVLFAIDTKAMTIRVCLAPYYIDKAEMSSNFFISESEVMKPFYISRMESDLLGVAC